MSDTNLRDEIKKVLKEATRPLEFIIVHTRKELAEHLAEEQVNNKRVMEVWEGAAESLNKIERDFAVHEAETSTKLAEMGQDIDHINNKQDQVIRSLGAHDASIEVLVKHNSHLEDKHETAVVEINKIKNKLGIKEDDKYTNFLTKLTPLSITIIAITMLAIILGVQLYFGIDVLPAFGKLVN